MDWYEREKLRKAERDAIRHNEFEKQQIKHRVCVLAIVMLAAVITAIVVLVIAIKSVLI